jgi:hypothetical protein
MHYREILSVFAIAFTLIAFAPYIRSIIKDKIKPHVFSWFIWDSTTFVVFLAYVKRADISITKTDWLFLISAISSLPLWYFTSDPLWAVIILTVVDVLGFGPTVRKAYFMPHSESLLFFALFTARNLIVILALENYSVTTVLFPAVIAAVCTLLLVMIFYRRRASLP